MKLFLIAFWFSFLGFFIVFHAVAGEDTSCVGSVKEFKKAMGPRAVTVDMTPAQFHFSQGFMTAVPPPGLPPGDAGLIVTIDDKSAIVFILKGKLCNAWPLPESFFKILKGMKDGPGEIL